MQSKTKQLPVQILEIVKKESALPQTKIQRIAKHYAPFMQQVNEIAAQVATLEKGNPDHIETAKRARITLGTICSQVEQQKKSDKSSLLLEGNFYQALYNTVNSAARLTQNEAKEIEKFAELEAKRKAEELHISRIAQVQEYGVDGTYINLGEMSEEVWQNFLLGTKTSYQQKLDAEEKAAQDEKDRIAKAEKKQKEAERQLKIQQKAAQKREAELKLEMETALKNQNALEEVGIVKTLEQVRKLTAKQYNALMTKGKKEQQQKQAQQQKEQKAAREQLAQRKKLFIDLGGFADIGNELMHAQLTIRITAMDLQMPQNLFDALYADTQAKIKEYKAKEKRLTTRYKQLKQLGFTTNGGAWLHAKANYRIFNVSVFGMEDQAWNESIKDFQEALAQKIAAIKAENELAERKRKEAEQEQQARALAVAPDKQKIEAFMADLLSTKTPELDTSDGQHIMEKINEMLMRMETYVSNKLEAL
jgi:hypothetical protein